MGDEHPGLPSAAQIIAVFGGWTLHLQDGQF
jgi:hypothetical protein